MPNMIEYAQIFQRQLDKAAVQEATSGWMEPNGKLIQYTGGADVKIPSMTVDGLGDYDRNKGYPKGSVNLTYETKKMTQDRAKRFTLDAMDVSESNFLATAAAVMGEFQRTQVVPEIDSYRYSSIAKQAMEAEHAVYGYTPAEASILKKLYDDITEVQDKVGQSEPLVITMSMKVAAILDLNEKLARNLSVTDFAQGDITLKVKSLEGKIPIIRVAGERLKTAYDFKTGWETDGAQFSFAPAANALDINWIICPRSTPIAVSRTDNMRIFDPQTFQDANAWAIDYRRYHDLWILKNKLPGIVVNIKQAKPTASTTPSGSGE